MSWSLLGRVDYPPNVEMLDWPVILIPALLLALFFVHKLRDWFK